MEETKKPEEAKVKTTIKARGARLPLGIMHGGTLHQDLAVRDWRMKEERELGRLRDENKDANLAKYVSLVLCTMCTRLGPHDFDKMTFGERELAVSTMYLGDVFYAYVWLRIQSLGEDFKIKFSPAWTNKTLDIVADLLSVEVNTAESIEDALWEHTLKTPIEMRGAMVTGFKLGPVRWQTMENIDSLGGGDMSGVKSAMLTAAIVGASGIDGQIHLSDSDLDELTKYDLEHLTDGVDVHNLGPIMRVDGKHRGREFTASIDWGYDRFFAVSST